MSRLPSLGARGEGWVAVQVVLIVAVVLTGLLGPAWNGWPRVATLVIGLSLIAGGLWLSGRGVVDLRAALTPLPYPRDDAELVMTGAYRWVRHPIYGGLVLAAFGWGLATASPPALALAVGLLGFFELKARREEAWLVERFPDYSAYRARTRRLIPWIG